MSDKLLKWIVHFPADSNKDRPDLHLVKYTIPSANGDVPQLSLLENYQRKFWITRKNKRDHTTGKEYESIENLLEHKCTDSELDEKLRVALEIPKTVDAYKRARLIKQSPYVYGIASEAQVSLAHGFREKYPGIGGLSVCAFDTETMADENGFGAIFIAQAAMLNPDKSISVKLCYRHDWTGEVFDPAEITNMIKAELGEKYKRVLHITITRASTTMGVIRSVFDWIHERKPDILAIWNMTFDIDRIVEACTESNTPPETIFSDPSIPERYRYFEYIMGPTTRRKQDGKVLPIPRVEQWHTVKSTSSFYCICAEATYRRLRLAAPATPTKLDYILNKELGYGKMMFGSGDNAIKESVDGLAWHQLMRDKYKKQYLCYSVWDVVSMVELDDKTKDLANQFPIYMGNTPWHYARSNPKRIIDQYHFYALKHGKVIGTYTPSEETFKTLGMNNWILLLDADMVRPMKTGRIAECPDIRTPIKSISADTDCVSAYPSTGIALNIEKMTTSFEPAEIPQGMSENEFRYANMNIVASKANAVGYCRTMFNFPALEDLP